MAQKINEAVELMRFMKLPGMAESYEKQLKDPSYQNISFEKRLLELLNSENDSRINHAVERYIANGNFPYRQPTLSISIKIHRENFLWISSKRFRAMII